MLASLNGRSKLPVGYVSHNKINVISQTELIKSFLTQSYNSGLTVWSVTCDGAYTNFSDTEYCRTIDRIFDVLNSKSKFSKGYYTYMSMLNTHNPLIILNVVVITTFTDLFLSCYDY